MVPENRSSIIIPWSSGIILWSSVSIPWFSIPISRSSVSISWSSVIIPRSSAIIPRFSVTIPWASGIIPTFPSVALGSAALPRLSGVSASGGCARRGSRRLSLRLTYRPPVNSALHVALVGPLPPYRGGIAHFTQSLQRSLGARGHRTSAVTFARQYPERLFPGTTQFEDAPAEDGAPRLLDSLGPRSWGRTARHLLDGRPDVVVFQYWHPFFAPGYGRVARRLRKEGVRVLALVHNALPHERRRGDRALSRYFLRACDGAVVLSASVRRDVEALVPGLPVRQVAHPVYDLFGSAVPREAARRALDLPEAAPVLLFFGFVRRYKGLHVLLDAMPDVLGRLPEARLVVAGEFYDEPAPYREQVQRHDLHEAVRFDAAYVPSDRVALYFSAADLVVQPYVSATQSGVAQVAFHFGRPVVTTDVGGLAETVPDGEAGLVVPPEDPAALAAAIVRFFEDGLAQRMAEGVRRERAKTDWGHVCEAIEALAVNDG